MGRIGCLLFVLFFISGVGFFMYFDTNLIEDSQVRVEKDIVNEQIVEEKTEDLQISTENFNHTLSMQMIGRSVEEVIAEFGQPIRKDKSPYGYTSYIYSDGLTYQWQIGVDKQNQVSMVYVIGNDTQDEPIRMGMEYEQLQRRFGFSNQVSLKTGDGLFDFQLNEQDLQERPLIKVNDMWVQLYFDSFTKELSSYRYLTKEVLLAQRPYMLSYRGNLPELIEPSEDDWSKIEEAASQQILEITNVIRYRHKLSPLKWEQDTANVAYGHSKDMALQGYFSHVSPTEGELIERLSKGGITYSIAAENIAANYVDAIGAVQGWLNSEGHRVNMLNEEFTYLGIGVYKKHYTQNFITKW